MKQPLSKPHRALTGAESVVRSCALAIAATLPCVIGSTAHAFQNPDTFPAESTQGGGGGRYFTGAPLDSYTCEVCHRSEETPRVQVFGLPAGNYQAGGIYRVTIDWPDDLARVALTMEMTDRTGRAVGAWSDPDPATLTPADLCTLATDSPIPTRALEAPGPRTVISAIDCGQHQITLNWTAPAPANPLVSTPLPDAMLNGALVVSNTNGKLAGDSAATFSKDLAAPGAPPIEETSISANCSVLAVQSKSDDWMLGLFLTSVAIVVVRVRQRRAESRSSESQTDTQQRETFDVAKRVGKRRPDHRVRFSVVDRER